VPEPDVDGAVLAEWVETTIFSDTRLRPGYDQQEVFAFLNAIRDSFLGVRKPSLTPDEIRVKQFSTTRLGPGYDQGEVDAFLNEAGSRLAAQLGARRENPAAAPESGPADPVQIRCVECGADSAEPARVCARCGAPAAEPARVCARCGAPAAEPGPGTADPAAEAVQIRCLECGMESAEPARICTRCGAPAAYQPLVADDQAAGQKVRPGSSARGPLIVVGVAIALLAVIAVIAALISTSSADQLTEDQLQPGDCLTGSNLGLGSGGTWPDLVTAVPCTKQHLAEVFFAGNAWPQSRADPGDNAISDQAYARCLTAFSAYDGTDNSDSAFTIDYVAPSSGTDWASGDRQVACMAYQPGVPVNYSIKGSNK
jgi:DivIVA domain-containing protein